MNDLCDTCYYNGSCSEEQYANYKAKMGIVLVVVACRYYKPAEGK